MKWLARLLRREKPVPQPAEVLQKLERVLGPDLRELRRFEIVVRRR